MATFSSIALRVFACALRLSPRVASGPQRGPPRRLAALLRGGWEGDRERHEEQRQNPEGGCRGGGRGRARGLAHRGSERPSALKKEGALNHSEEAIRALSGNIPASAFPRRQAQYYSLHTVYSPGHHLPHTGSSPQLCSCLASGVGGEGRDFFF